MCESGDSLKGNKETGMDKYKEREREKTLRERGERKGTKGTHGWTSCTEETEKRKEEEHSERWNKLVQG